MKENGQRTAGQKIQNHKNQPCLEMRQGSFLRKFSCPRPLNTLKNLDLSGKIKTYSKVDTNENETKEQGPDEE